MNDSGRHVVTMDIAGAYLKASMSSIAVYMYLEPALYAMLCELVSGKRKFVMKNSRMVLKLDKVFYECIESTKLWHQHIKGALEKIGLVPDPDEGCCNIRWFEDKQRTAIAYGDDPPVTRKSVVTRVVEGPKAKCYDVQKQVSPNPTPIFIVKGCRIGECGHSSI